MHPLQRTGATAVVLGALGVGFVAGVTFGRSPTDATDQTTQARHPLGGDAVSLVNADLRPAASCEELLAWYVDHGVDRVTPYGWDYLRVYALEDNAAGSPEPTRTTGEATSEVTSSATGTNVQEAGVDEPDVVKTDGSLLVRVVDGSTLVVYDVTGDEPVRLGSVPLVGMFSPELLLAGDRVVVIGRDTGPGQGRIAPGSQLRVVDIADPSAPTVVHEASYDSSLVTARQHGDVVRLVVSVGLPDLDFVQPGFFRRETTALERNQEIVRASTIDAWLPHVTTVGTDGAVREQLVGCDDVAIPAADAGLGTVAVIGFDVNEPTAVETTAVTTPSETVYMSADRLYLASSAYRMGWEACCWSTDAPGDVRLPMQQPEPAWSSGDEGTSYLYDFDLDGLATTYAASGRVDGTIANRWAMDEYDGVLRLAVGPSMQTGDFNSIVTLSRTGSTLVELGRVEKLGVGEDIKSMRWFDGLAVMVTFRQTDPFYAVDLSDPSAPVLLGELKIPGFSSYLHPIDGDLMIGMGSSASSVTGAVRGAKASLYDISDLTAPRQLDTVEYPADTTAQAAIDPRQFTWLPDRRTALTVISSGWDGRTGYVSVLRVVAGAVTNELVEVEYGVDVDAVRLVPLPDGRVVLTTGDDVSFFPLGG